MDEPILCAHCGEAFPVSQCTNVDGQALCPHCLEETSVLCQACGTRLLREDAWEAEGDLYCFSCYEENFLHCERCGQIIPRGEACYFPGNEEPYCDDCYDRIRQRKVIANYYYKPIPFFFGKGERFFGVELEVDEGGESDENAKEILAQANPLGREHAYAKHDGSLDEGFEIVTHPMTLAYHCQEMPWQEVLDTAVALGYRSHQADTCGLHVHVNRTAFGPREADQDPVIARILYFVEKHWEELLKFSRRTPRQLERWATRYGYREQPQDILEHAKKGYYGGRYTCVNLRNRSTIEFRMFRGTLKYNTLIATLQLVNRICDLALNLSDGEIQALSWTTFATACREPELIRYLKERRLYVNDPILSEEEL